MDLTKDFAELNAISNFEVRASKALAMAEALMHQQHPEAAEAVLSYLFTSLVNKAFATGLPREVVVSGMTDSMALSSMFLTNGNAFVPREEEIQGAVRFYHAKLKNVQIKRTLENKYPQASERPS